MRPGEVSTGGDLRGPGARPRQRPLPQSESSQPARSDQRPAHRGAHLRAAGPDRRRRSAFLWPAGAALSRGAAAADDGQLQLGAHRLCADQSGGQQQQSQPAAAALVRVQGGDSAVLSGAPARVQSELVESHRLV